MRPQLVVGFAAETENVIENATAKRLRKGCDWIVANDVAPETGIMGGACNKVTVIGAAGAETWDEMYDAEQKLGLIFKIATFLTIFVALLGLLGLSSFVSEQKTKEIGIRKVVGASVSSILMLLYREFIGLILLGKNLS